MKHENHRAFVEAIRGLASVRQSFTTLATDKLILGNDNHIGDIGEYWVRRYFEEVGTFKGYGGSKNSLFDIQLADGTQISVKTITAWSKTGYGTQVRPLNGENWTVLAAVFLGENLFPERLSIVPLESLLSEPEFKRNAERRGRENAAIKAYPRFQWWPWLSKYKKHFRIETEDLLAVMDE